MKYSDSKCHVQRVRTQRHVVPENWASWHHCRSDSNMRPNEVASVLSPRDTYIPALIDYTYTCIYCILYYHYLFYTKKVHSTKNIGVH